MTNNTTIITNEQALAAKKKHDEMVALSEGFSILFREMPASVVIEQLNAAVDNGNAPALKAGINVLAERGEFDVIARFIQRVTGEKSEVFANNLDLRSVLAKSMLALKNRVTPLHAYGKALTIREAFFREGETKTNFISLEDFFDNKPQEGDSGRLTTKLAFDKLAPLSNLFK